VVYIGIDPGAKGALAIINTGGEPIEIILFDAKTYINAIADVSTFQCIACVEKVGAWPGQGVTSMFTFGKNAGFIEGVLQSHGIPYQLIPPPTWKKEFQLNKSKQKSVDVCKKLFPKVSLLPTERCRKESDGMAEALLMAEYARRKL
jgi:crossover junction endodeoxyribonuclease RuvC